MDGGAGCRRLAARLPSDFDSVALRKEKSNVADFRYTVNGYMDSETSIDQRSIHSLTHFHSVYASPSTLPDKMAILIFKDAARKLFGSHTRDAAFKVLFRNNAGRSRPPAKVRRPVCLRLVWLTELGRRPSIST